MRVLIVGEFLYPHGLAQSYYRAFKKLGVDVSSFDLRKNIPWFWNQKESIKDCLTGRIKRRLEMHILNLLSNRHFKRKVELGKLNEFQLILVIKSPWLTKKTLSLVQRMSNSLIFHFNADSPFDAGKANKHLNLTDTIPLYDAYFIWNKAIIPKLYERGAKRVEYLPFAWDPELHPLNSITIGNAVNYTYDISFIGNWDLYRENQLFNLMEFNMTIWGGYLWERANNSSLLRHWTQQIPTGAEFAEVCRTSKINLNFLRDQNKSSHNMRTFEVPGCGGFLLTERSKEQCKIFEENKEIACFSTSEELKKKIEFFLPRDALRQKMAQVAHRKVANEHTYPKRAEKILRVYEALKNR